MLNITKMYFTASLLMILSANLLPAKYAIGQPANPKDEGSKISMQHQGYEAVLGMTSRAQALMVFEGRGDKKLAVMTGNFEPSLQLYVTTPFHILGEEVADGVKVSHHGYYWKYSYNRFSLDRQEDPDTGGIGWGSSVYDYGTIVEGEFFALAPVYALEVLRPDGTVPFRIELGLGAGHFFISGDIVLGDQRGQPGAVKTDIEYSGPAFFMFIMGQHYWKSWLFGYQMGTMSTSSTPYSFSQGFVALDFGYHVLF